MDEQNLVEAAKHGDRKAMTELVKSLKRQFIILLSKFAVILKKLKILCRKLFSAWLNRSINLTGNQNYPPGCTELLPTIA